MRYAKGELQSLWPSELAHSVSWIAWANEPSRKNSEKLVKTPYSPKTGRLARGKYPEFAQINTVTKAEAKAYWVKNKHRHKHGGGIGLVLGSIPSMEGVCLGGIDLDTCRDPETGKVAVWARNIMRRLHYIYWEKSPSQTGFKGYFLHSDANADSATFKLDTGKSHPPGIEIYFGKRWFAWTGDEVLDLLENLRSIATIKNDDSTWLQTVAGPKLARQGKSVDSASHKPMGRSEKLYAYAARVRPEGYSYERYCESAKAECPEGFDHAHDQEIPERAFRRAWNDAPEPVQFEALEPDPDAKPHFVEELNLKHAVVRTGGKTVIADLKDDGVDFGSPNDLHNLYANRRASKGEGRSVPISELWMQHKKRRTYEAGVTFDPSGKCGPDILNLWTGFAVEPNPIGDCELIKQHIHKVIAKGNRDHADYVLGWLADMVQRPGEKPGVAIILKGKKGAGKDTVAEVMARIIGRKHCPSVADKNQLTGRFNSHFAAALMLQVQEGFWAGDRQAESPLKALVTSETIAIERKGIDVINIKSCMRLVITSNADWVVPASADERRWAIFEVSDKRCGNREYFDALYSEINGDGPGAFLHYLQNYDLDGFDVRKPPETDGRLDQILASLRNFERYWLNALRTGRVADSRDWEGGEVTIITSDLVEDYNQFAKENRFGVDHLDERAIGHKLHDLCPVVLRKRGKRPERRWVYQFPNLDSCRAAFDKYAGGKVHWDE